MKTEKLTGEKLAKAAVNQILQHPETWNQETWHDPCGTKHCFAGWCQILSGNKISDSDAKNDAQKALAITDFEASVLFRPSASLIELYSFAKNYNIDGYDRDGYDRAGYNIDGYTRDGYNRDGYNRDGYDRAGYNRDGYDMAGYDMAGYNRDGYDRAGIKIELTPFEL